MKKVKTLLLLLISVSFFSNSCKKGNDAEKRFQEEQTLIRNFIATNNIPAVTDDSGVYYQIVKPGTGNVTYTGSTNILVKYTLRVLGGEIIQQTDQEIPLILGGVIPGWQIGIPKIQAGGKIRLFIPSIYAYGSRTQPGIPPNSVLDFDIDLVGVGLINQE